MHGFKPHARSYLESNRQRGIGTCLYGGFPLPLPSSSPGRDFNDFISGMRIFQTAPARALTTHTSLLLTACRAAVLQSILTALCWVITFYKTFLLHPYGVPCLLLFTSHIMHDDGIPEWLAGLRNLPLVCSITTCWFVGITCTANILYLCGYILQK